MPLIACSACHAAITPGATSYPGCGLPLITQALPVKERKPRLPLWLKIVFSMALIVLAGRAIESTTPPSQPSGEETFLHDLHAGQLATAAAFQARCSLARWAHQTNAGTELHYLVNGGDYYVSFGSMSPRFEAGYIDMSGKKPKEYRPTLVEQSIYATFGCR